VFFVVVNLLKSLTTNCEPLSMMIRGFPANISTARSTLVAWLQSMRALAQCQPVGDDGFPLDVDAGFVFGIRTCFPTEDRFPTDRGSMQKWTRREGWGKMGVKRT
jgi:hypothetical protein